MRFREAIILAGVCALFASCGEERRAAEQDDLIESEARNGADVWLRAPIALNLRSGSPNAKPAALSACANLR